MKKLFVLVAALLACMAITAQDKKGEKERKSAISFNAGAALPLGDFADDQFSINEDALFAKTGIYFNVNYDYRPGKKIGFACNMIYGYHNIKKDLKQLLWGINTDHYQYFGVLAGPMLKTELFPGMDIYLRPMAGISRINTPSFSFEGMILEKEQWSTTIVFKVDVNFQYNLTKRTFFMLNTGYTQMRPEYEFKKISLGLLEDDFKYELNIENVNISAGFGIKF